MSEHLSIMEIYRRVNDGRLTAAQGAELLVSCPCRACRFVARVRAAVSARSVRLAIGVHRVHHIQWAWGYVLTLARVGYFPGFGVRRVKGHGIDLHDCDTTGVR